MRDKKDMKKQKTEIAELRSETLRLEEKAYIKHRSLIKGINEHYVKIETLQDNMDALLDYFNLEIISAKATVIKKRSTNETEE